MNTLYKEIGQRIATLRQENKITQAQLAEKLDISIKHCSEVERGLSCFSLEKLIMICSILSTSLDYLIRGIDKRNASATDVPLFVYELFKSSDDHQKELLQEYILLFKKISENK